MKRRLILLNVVLLAAIAAAGNALRDRYLAAKAHEQQVLKQKTPAVPAPQIPDTPKTPPVAAATYADVAQKMLFTRDRNPNVIVEPPKVPPPKVMPPLPFAYGVMDFGSGPIVLLAEKAGGQNKSYHPGDKIGEFKIAAVSSREITFEWDGKEIKKRLEELVDKKAGETAAAAAETAAASAPKAAAPPPPPPPVAEAKPGIAMGENKGCQPGDNSPPGTVADGYKKVRVNSPFGSTCYWEPVK